MKMLVAIAALAASAGAFNNAWSADKTTPEGVVRLSAMASTEVTQDLLTITFGTTREGNDAATVQSQLKQALDAALGEARKAARPGQVDVQTGRFSLAPRYTDKGVANGWRGSAELIVSGRDTRAIGELAGRITTLTVGQVAQDLSHELREQSEAEVAARAIADYRAKAADYAKQFGYASYALREIDVAAQSQPGVPRDMGLRQRAMAMASAAEPLPVEPGKGTVSVVVSGTIQLTR